jgi:hypothetical protein
MERRKNSFVFITHKVFPWNNSSRGNILIAFLITRSNDGYFPCSIKILRDVTKKRKPELCLL